MANPRTLPGGTAFLAGFSRQGILRGHHRWLHKSRPSFTHLWEKPGRGGGRELAAGVLVLLRPCPELCQFRDCCGVLISESGALWGQAPTRPS